MLHPLTAKSLPLKDTDTPDAFLTRSRHWKSVSSPPMYIVLSRSIPVRFLMSRSWYAFLCDVTGEVDSMCPIAGSSARRFWRMSSIVFSIFTSRGSTSVGTFSS